uniref:V-SNARE coiled-coil homology domain-containing protein n=1 Tax=Poecilia reticulata TaxID=8081 RepID=A0A3P9PM72_POERE
MSSADVQFHQVLIAIEEGKSRLEQTQEEVEQVKDIMLDNMKKADERSGKLNDLEQQAEDLLEKGKVFEKKASKLKQQKKMSNKKMKIIFISIGVVAGLVVLGLIIFAVIG